MISFCSMPENHYPGYLEYFIPDYAREIQANYRLSQSAARARAEQEIAELLFEGVNTPGHTLLNLIVDSENTNKHIGFLWYKPDTAMRTAFIYDFHIFEPYQGNGLGKQTLNALEQDLRDKGFDQIRLRVAGDNARARHIYEACGFGVTGINMSKTLTD
ncbi:GNAT family N-acetyltransferase [Pantoea agglomerans]|uniref:GNAT family N-acetyltransferase n=1 Tax=Enterobacter agglomerans TaxID=549 RepID=UPI003DA0ADF7